MLSIRLLIIAAMFSLFLLAQGCAPAVVAGATTGAVAAHDKRTVGAFIDDANIEAKSRSILYNEKTLEDAHINVTSINGVALITGEAPTEEAAALILEKIRAINGVRRTVNQIQISPASSFGSRTKDTWITSKVKTSLVAEERVDSTRVKVVTESTVVYLMGLIRQEEGRFAAEAARKVKGVTKVVKLFEYVD